MSNCMNISSNSPVEMKRQSSLDRLSTEYDTASMVPNDSLYKKRQGDSREEPGFFDSRSPHERGCNAKIYF